MKSVIATVVLVISALNSGLAHAQNWQELQDKWDELNGSVNSVLGTLQSATSCGQQDHDCLQAALDFKKQQYPNDPDIAQAEADLAEFQSLIDMYNEGYAAQTEALTDLQNNALCEIYSIIWNGAENGGTQAEYDAALELLNELIDSFNETADLLEEAMSMQNDDFNTWHTIIQNDIDAVDGF